jgi:TrmH family RNA methyltransferase
VVEGATLLAGALEAGAEVETVFVDSSGTPPRPVAAVIERALDAGARVFPLAPGVLARVADTVSPQPVLAVVHTPRHGLEAVEGASFVVVLVDVRDPGNAGTVIRSADAAGADAVICCEGSVDPWNPKTVRSSAGSVLHLPVVSEVGVEEVMERIGAVGMGRLGAVARGGTPYTEVDWTGPVALLLGNEAGGLPAAVEAGLDGRTTIPMAGRAESLNVSMAASVLCFEVLRQRSNLPGMETGR